MHTSQGDVLNREDHSAYKLRSVRKLHTLLDADHASDEGFVVSPASVCDVRIVNAGVVARALRKPQNVSEASLSQRDLCR